ncbi:tRNA (adenine(22)-N(1))-methyltransferase [Eupransor demetentiae]|uniref:tRNA A22 N1-methylase (TrmK) n=1 Tax=Eupransor demetentiae TaxID=3109584 RepID=A0ABP0EQ83_9LACO|nr:tRNA A22 N1-methylase (TrmK) [Lactobacillaceae bacterium LMG 33000]
MTAPVHLSPRLQAVSNYVKPKASLADIGSDHAYLPAFLLSQKVISHAIAGEVALGPLENARREIVAAGLQGSLIARQANGLDAITSADHVDTVVIAGMGGLLIADIMERDFKTHNQRQFPYLILQPNNNERAVRKWLIEHHYCLMSETIVQEDEHYYEIIYAVPGHQELDLLDLKYGPYLRRERSEAFQRKWNGEVKRINLILGRLAQAEKEDSTPYRQWAAEVRQIQGVLQG